MASILVIEDDNSVRESLCEILTREGYEVIDVNDGNNGVEAYRKQKSDLVITDIVMPEKEGIEVVTELKKEFPEVKIIAISGGGLNVNKDFCLEAAKGLGVEYVFSKPFSKEEILKAVKDLIG